MEGKDHFPGSVNTGIISPDDGSRVVAHCFAAEDPRPSESFDFAQDASEKLFGKEACLAQTARR
jgi:hypothetical protein